MLTKALGKLLGKKAIELSVYERIILLEIIDKINIDFVVKKVIAEVENKIGFSDRELDNLQIGSKNGQVFWKTDYDKKKTILVGKTGRFILRDCLLELEEKLEDNKELIEKFK